MGLFDRTSVEINGVKVTSSKAMSGIHNSRVDFADGSWCDVSTGEVKNKGNGYIKMNGKPFSDGVSETKKVGPTSYPVLPLSIEDLPFGVRINVHDRDEILVTLEGDESEVDAIKITESGQLAIRGSNGSSNGSVSISGVSIFQSVGSVSIGSNIVCGNNSRGKIGATITVPKGVSIAIEGISGPIEVDDVEGDLDVRLRGASDAAIGKIRNLKAKCSGSSDLLVVSVIGNVTIETSGSSDINIRGGQIDHLEVETSGSSDINVRGEAKTATIRTSGSGDVYVRHVEEQPTVKRSGSSDVKIGNWPSW